MMSLYNEITIQWSHCPKMSPYSDRCNIFESVIMLCHKCNKCNCLLSYETFRNDQSAGTSSHGWYLKCAHQKELQVARGFPDGSVRKAKLIDKHNEKKSSSLSMTFPCTKSPVHHWVEKKRYCNMKINVTTYS